MTPEHALRLQRFIDLFEARGPDGRRRFERRDLLAFLPLVLRGVDLTKDLAAGLSPLILESAAMLGVHKDMPAADVDAKLAELCEQNPRLAPLRDALLQELDRLR